MPSSTESTEVKKTFDYETTILNLLVDERLENLFNSTNDAASSSSVEISSSSSNLNTGFIRLLGLILPTKNIGSNFFGNI